MADNISPFRKAKRFLIAGAVLTVTVPFAFGFNVFLAAADWVFGNWPRLLIIGALAFWFAKNHSDS
jgi:hypothetical protein